MLIRVSPADVAGCRYAISPLFEVEGAMFLLTGSLPAGALRDWVVRTRPRLAEVRRAEPAIEALISLQRRTENADFLHPPPLGPRREFAEELAALRATPLARARAELARNLRGHKTPSEKARRILDADDVVDRLADALQAAWTAFVEPDWPRLRAVLERDIMHRAGRIAAFGWAAGLDGLHPRLSWRPEESTIEIKQSVGDHHSGDRGLMLVPTVFGNLAISTDPERPVTIAYRARGVADILSDADVSHPGLAPLLGAGRAAVLRALTVPTTTSQLAARLGMSLGGVAGHLKVLARAGLISRSRNGRSVLYATTEKGDSLLSWRAARC
ncbi:ArsR/SmtB family transcription factor [Symbioplanes lichenis]|uniref:ArsR/SmtB family transcription factor n=1 Tax=Symbioplanes lichenis TaxID=1629072 RepID=UPI0027393F06|nr:DUF5937 family protein [Actinoplanes lichenis]